jgi:hypothetical protein
VETWDNEVFKFINEFESVVIATSLPIVKFARFVYGFKGEENGPVGPVDIGWEPLPIVTAIWSLEEEEAYSNWAINNQLCADIILTGSVYIVLLGSKCNHVGWFANNW